jgi:hypothetical protein
MSEHGRLEIVNGICLAASRKAISAEAMRDALASFDEDLAAGRYAAADVLWRASNVKLLEQVRLAVPRRALVTILGTRRPRPPSPTRTVCRQPSR